MKMKDEGQFWSFLQFTYEEAEALRQASIGEDHGHISMGQLTVWLEESIITYTRYLLVLQKVPSEANPKVRNHGEGPY